MVLRIDGLRRSFQFEPWEPIRTERSGKYLESDIRGLAERSGFTARELYFDDQKYFCDALCSIEDPAR